MKAFKQKKNSGNLKTVDPIVGEVLESLNLPNGKDRGGKSTLIHNKMSSDEEKKILSVLEDVLRQQHGRRIDWGNVAQLAAGRGIVTRSNKPYTSESMKLTWYRLAKKHNRSSKAIRDASETRPQSGPSSSPEEVEAKAEKALKSIAAIQGLDLDAVTKVELIGNLLKRWP
jgi:hypothetical protein